MPNPITGDDTPNTLNGTNGDDTIYGYGATDHLYGLNGNDILDGGVGSDVMNGGAGNDTYYVDDAKDWIIDASGTDSVFTYVNYSLAGEAVENITLSGTANLNATGNGLNNHLTGNSGNNVLDGGAGADVMIGGAGDDTYYVDNVNDNVVEGKGSYEDNYGGNDTVYSSVSYSLAGRYVETLILTGTANINATANSYVNTLMGNSGNNVFTGNYNTILSYENAPNAVDINLSNGTSTGFGTDTIVGINTVTGSDYNDTITGSDNFDVIRGGAGNDTIIAGGGTDGDALYGGTGDDTYYLSGDTQYIYENPGEGNDTVYAIDYFNLDSNVENGHLTGNKNGVGYGNSGNNKIFGDASNNVLSGGYGGTDYIQGGAGEDKFYFYSALNENNLTTITDFTVGTDMIELSLDAFSAIGADGPLAPPAFLTGTQALSPANRIIYNKTTGDIYYDPDGNGSAAQVKFAHITPGLALSAASFTVSG